MLGVASRHDAVSTGTLNTRCLRAPSRHAPPLPYSSIPSSCFAASDIKCDVQGGSHVRPRFRHEDCDGAKAQLSPHSPDQLASLRPATRRNSDWLRETSVAFSWTACAAMSRSIAPMVRPEASSCALMSP